MWVVFFVIICVVSEAVMKENFRVVGQSGVTTAQALEACFLEHRCSLTQGCCHGHGYCLKNGAAAAQCVCDAPPQECRAGLNPVPNYTGDFCETAPADCCVDGSDQLIFSGKGMCTKRDGDPERGALGNILMRSGAASYSDADKVSSPSVWNETLDQMLGVLNHTSRGIVLTSMNMFALGVLQLALKDTVDLYFNNSNNVTIYGKIYPTALWQNNTGLKVGNVTIPKMFAMNSTAAIDLQPYYNFAHRKGGSPYMDLTDAVVHWQYRHHQPEEFITVLKTVDGYHYYAARNIEEYFCGQNSTITAITNVCSIRGNFASDQEMRDYFFILAQRSTIRWFQNLVQTSALQHLIEYGGDDGFWEPTLEHWIRRDAHPAHGYGFTNDELVSVREHQEWAGDLIRTNLTLNLASYLDFFVSLRNPNVNTTAGDMVDDPCDNIIPSVLAPEAISLMHTRTQRYGSQIHDIGYAALQIYRANELGLPSYPTHVLGLTNTPSVGGLSSQNVWYGAQLETDAARRYKNTTASVAFASTVHINDVLIVDETSYWHYDEYGYWTAQNYHPDPLVFTLPAYSYGSCYMENDECTPTAKNAAAILIGYNEYMVDNDIPEFYRSRGALFPAPLIGYGYVPVAQYDTYCDYQTRINFQWTTLPDLLNVFFYQYDGIASLAYKQAGSDTSYLPNQLVDAIPTNVGWLSSAFDGWCFDPTYFTPTCDRYDTNRYAGICLWWWTGPL